MMVQANFPALETGRLLLREVVAEDAPALFAIHGNAELMRWFGNDPIPDLAGAEALIKIFNGWRQLPNPGTRWAIEIKGTPGLIGTCGLFAWNRNWRKCIVGCELAKNAQGQGYMHDVPDRAHAGRFLIDQALEGVRLRPPHPPPGECFRRVGGVGRRAQATLFVLLAASAGAGIISTWSHGTRPVMS